MLEVLQILEGEVNLREETRVAEQVKPALPEDEYGDQADKLSETQDGLEDRVVKVTDRIRELPDGEMDFAYEINLLETVAMVMNETTEILARPETGPPAIGAETEVIELLLQSRRINPGRGGGPRAFGSGRTDRVAGRGHARNLRAIPRRG